MAADMHDRLMAQHPHRWWSPYGWKRDGWKLRRLTYGDLVREMFPEGFKGLAVRYGRHAEGGSDGE